MSALRAVEPTDEEEEKALGEFEGCMVVEVGFECSNSSGGLQKSLDVDEFLMELLHEKQIGDRFQVVLDVDVTKIRHQPVKGAEDKLRRICITRCVEAAVLPKDGIKAVEKVLDEQRKRREKALDEIKNRAKLPGIDDPEPVGQADQGTTEGTDEA